MVLGVDADLNGHRFLLSARRASVLIISSSSSRARVRASRASSVVRPGESGRRRRVGMGILAERPVLDGADEGLGLSIGQGTEHHGPHVGLLPPGHPDAGGSNGCPRPW